MLLPLRRFLMATLAALFCISATQAADWTWLVVDRHPQALGAAGAGRLAVGREPLAGVATAVGDLVTLYSLAEDGTLLAQGSFLGETRLTALAVDDLEADGRTEVVSAHGEEGTLTVDRWVDGQRLAVGMPRYAWAPVEDLRVASTRSGRLVVASGQAGSLLTYSATGRGLEPLGTLDLRQRVDLVAAADLDGDNQDELVGRLGPAEVIVLRWVPGVGWARWWQNFPWGGVAAVAVADVDRDGRLELVVASNERLLYVFGRNAAGSGLELRAQIPGLLPAGQFTMVGLAGMTPVSGPTERSDPPPAGVAVVAPDGIRILSFSAKFELTQGFIPLGGVARAYPFGSPVGGRLGVWPRLLVVMADGSLESVAALPAERLRLVWQRSDGAEVPAGGVCLGGRWYVTVRELESRLGLRLKWDDTRKVAEVTSPDGRRIELPAGRAPMLDGREISEAGLVVADAGRLLLEARGVERLFPPSRPEAPRLLVVGGRRPVPATQLW